MSSLIALFIFSALTIYGDLQPLGQSIYNRCAYTMTYSWYLISYTAEFSTGMKNGKYNLYRRNPCRVVEPDRNSSSIIDNSNGIVRIEDVYKRQGNARILW